MSVFGTLSRRNYYYGVKVYYRSVVRGMVNKHRVHFILNKSADWNLVNKK